jgi:TRAP-type C4-dicarboxylate transport system permease small subunit
MTTTRRYGAPGKLPFPIGVLEAIGNAVAHACLVVAALGLFAIVGINALNVGSRYFFDYAWSWAEEAEVFVMILSVFAGTVTASWREAHMKLEMFVSRMPGPAQRTVIAVVTIASATILFVLSAYSYQVVSLLYIFGQKGASIDFPMWVPQGCVLASFVLMGVMMLLRLAISFAKPLQEGLDGLMER